MFLDIVILPPKKLREKIGRNIKKAANDFPYTFVVDNRKLIPHLSLFHIRTTKGRIPNLAQKIRPILATYRPFKIRKTGVDLHGGQTVGFRLSRSQRLKRLHEEIVLRCYKLRMGAMPWPGLSELTALKKNYRRKYGSSHLLKLFNPHITVGLFRNEKDAQRVATALKKIEFQFLTETIAITEVNFWHQVTKILKTFKLK